MFKFAAVLALVFIVLKLCAVIAWSWWWVLAPLWIAVIVWLLIFAVTCVVIAKVR